MVVPDGDKGPVQPRVTGRVMSAVAAMEIVVKVYRRLSRPWRRALTLERDNVGWTTPAVTSR